MNNADIEIPRPERLETSFRIFVDQAGYLPTAEKTAVFTFPAGYYSVINETGSICFSGIPVPAGADEASGETLFKADFSRLTAPGNKKSAAQNARRSLSVTPEYLPTARR